MPLYPQQALLAMRWSWCSFAIPALILLSSSVSASQSSKRDGNQHHISPAALPPELAETDTTFQRAPTQSEHSSEIHPGLMFLMGLAYFVALPVGELWWMIILSIAQCLTDYMIEALSYEPNTTHGDDKERGLTEKARHSYSSYNCARNRNGPPRTAGYSGGSGMVQQATYAPCVSPMPILQANTGW